jgi:hypothetical protein
MANETFPELWALLKGEEESRRARFASESEEAWKSLESVLQKQVTATSGAPPPVPESGKVASIRTLIEGPGQVLLFDTITALRRWRAQERALAALESYGASLEDLTGRLPRTISISPNELSDVLGMRPQNVFRRYGSRAHEAQPWPLRRIVELHFLKEANVQASWQGEYFLLLAQASLLALSPWQDLRRESLPALAGQQINAGALSACNRLWTKQVEALNLRASKLLAEFHAWNAAATGRLARSILRARSHYSARRMRKLSTRPRRCFRFWSRQQRAIAAAWDLEWELSRLTLAVADEAERAIETMTRERTQLLSELDSVIRWLEHAQTSAPDGDFPPPAAKLATADDRTGDWQRATEAAARAGLPLTVETIEPRWNLPPRQPPWRTLEPQRFFLMGVARFGRERVLEGFREAETGHRAIIREIERAREVVAFSRETVAHEGTTGAGIAREGIANALSLVSFQKQNAADPGPIVEVKLVEGISSALIFTLLSLERRRLGVLKQLIRESGSSAAAEVSRAIAERRFTASHWLRDLLSDSYHRLLQKIGWETPPVTALQPVVSRAFFDELFNLKAGPHDLPMIYRRLFKLAPLEEPRFLVGRDTELAALARTRELWQMNRAVAVIVVGARGSGKTSLLNCASSVAFANVPVIRGQFQERITTAQQMRRFLLGLFQVPEEEDLMKFLQRGKTVVMLEELERTFLRCMNGFEGLRELLSIVASSSGSTLWIFSINQRSYRYLDAAVSLGQYFSHTINATAVAEAHLKNAILLRHHLSGLRLEYPPVPRSDPRMSRIRQLLGLTRNTEEMFFDSLYLQSEGVFRSAFELWQHFVERVEGGVLYLREPAEPNFEPLIAPLTLDDAFTLQAILQHGSLTEQEHAAIFECPIDHSGNRLKRLLALELLEPEPGGAGLRVRPEAGRIVHIALHRRNLV